MSAGFICGGVDLLQKIGKRVRSQTALRIVQIRLDVLVENIVDVFALAIRLDIVKIAPASEQKGTRVFGRNSSICCHSKRVFRVR